MKIGTKIDYELIGKLIIYIVIYQDSQSKLWLLSLNLNDIGIHTKRELVCNNTQRWIKIIY